MLDHDEELGRAVLEIARLNDVIKEMQEKERYVYELREYTSASNRAMLDTYVTRGIYADLGALKREAQNLVACKQPDGLLPSGWVFASSWSGEYGESTEVNGKYFTYNKYRLCT